MNAYLIPDVTLSEGLTNLPDASGKQGITVLSVLHLYPSLCGRICGKASNWAQSPEPKHRCCLIMGGLKFCSISGSWVPFSGSQKLKCFYFCHCCRKKGFPRVGRGAVQAEGCDSTPVLHLLCAMHVPSTKCCGVLCHLHILSPWLQDLLYTCERKFSPFLFSCSAGTPAFSLRDGSKCLPPSCLWVESLGFWFIVSFLPWKY